MLSRAHNTAFAGPEKRSITDIGDLEFDDRLVASPGLGLYWCQSVDAKRSWNGLLAINQLFSFVFRVFRLC